MNNAASAYLCRPQPIAPLVIFRVLFGMLMFFSMVRFMANGWVYELYVKPTVFFPYYGFEWIRPLPAIGMHALFVVLALAALGMAIGLFYRYAATIFFLGFTYVELLDKTNYLNHYYFVSLVSFLLIWIPAHRAYSVDAHRHRALRASSVPAWTLRVLIWQVSIVYIHAGIAKINSAWLIDAMPLRIWLPANNHLPIIGGLMDEVWVAYLFSWAGMLYDVFIVLFLSLAATRWWAYGSVVVFHLLTWWLFPIGMFPFIMIVSTLLFFPAQHHERVLRRVEQWWRPRSPSAAREEATPQDAVYPSRHAGVFVAMALFFVIQVVVPWRYLLYPGNVFWTEQGYRFSWRVMLMEKAGSVVFHVCDPATGRQGQVMPSDYLTPVQEKMMSTQPDMILQFAHFLEGQLRQRGIEDPVVRAEAYVTLNGAGSRKFIDDQVDLTRQVEGFHHKNWITDGTPAPL